MDYNTTGLSKQVSPHGSPAPALARQGFVLGRVPNGADEVDLVHKIREIVEQVQGCAVNAPKQVTEEVAQRVDAPADRDDVAHGLERLLHVLARASELRGALASLANEDLPEDEEPAAKPHDEAQNRVDEVRLARVARREHEDGAEEQAIEDPGAEAGLHRGEDQVELDHLQGDGDRPVDVAIKDRGAVELDPELAHVEVVPR